LSDTDLSRREFLARIDWAARTSLVTLSIPAILGAATRARAAQASGAAFSTLGAVEAREFAAIAARIVPTDETPGATEAGAIHFMDAVLGDSHGDLLPILREGLTELQALAERSHGSTSFAALTPEQQDRLLKEIEDGGFFGTIRFLTVAGTFSLPMYGGNREEIGWQLIGFENRHVHTAPYGYYDADYAARGE
jgi:gluconate 2-dehydrogenase gamma chain